MATIVQMLQMMIKMRDNWVDRKPSTTHALTEILHDIGRHISWWPHGINFSIFNYEQLDPIIIAIR